MRKTPLSPITRQIIMPETRRLPIFRHQFPLPDVVISNAEPQSDFFVLCINVI